MPDQTYERLHSNHQQAHRPRLQMRPPPVHRRPAHQEYVSRSPLPARAIAKPHLTNLVSCQQLQWPAFERDVLHAYRRAYRLKTPTAFVSDHHEWVFTLPGSIGLYSPTIARRKELRRQTKDQLTNAVRKHFNALGVQENDVIVDFLHKVRGQGITKKPSIRREFLVYG
jgi:hypothetical protein